MTNSPDVLLRVEHLKQYFKMGPKVLKAVDDVSFDIRRGEVFGLVGESGCGKTTTGRAVIRLYEPTGGSIWFDGQRISAGVAGAGEVVREEKRAGAKVIAGYRKAMRREIAADKGQSAAIAGKYKRLIYEERARLKKYAKDYRKEVGEAGYERRDAARNYKRNQIEAAKASYARAREELAAQSLSAGARAAAHSELRANYERELELARKATIYTKMQMIFQDPIASINPRMTVREIIAEGLIIRGVRDRKYIDEKVFEALDMVGLVPEHADRYPHEFSGGQRQRIGIARAIVLNPDFIIADEPISALDVSIQAQVINLLNDLRERMGLTILFIAHNLSVVKYFSDRIAVMYYGKIVELADSEELFRHPLHPYTKSLLSAIPYPDPHYEKLRKRVTYVPAREHTTYDQQKPSMRELAPGHFVYCNDLERDAYLAELAR